MTSFLNNSFIVSFIIIIFILELEEDVADDTLDHCEPLPSTSRGRSDADIALDRAMVFRYDAALDLVFKEEFTNQVGEENVQRQTVVNEPRRKRPRYGNYEFLFPESEEGEEQEREPEEVDCNPVAGEGDQVRQQQHLSSSPSTIQPSRRKREGRVTTKK